MDLKLYNTLSRSIEVFAPRDPRRVTLYSCGPTVYNYAHIGNWRSFLTADLLRRVLEYNGYEVKSVMNITDVDDKTISGSRVAGETLASFTKKYEEIFLADFASLNLLPPTKLTRATAYVGAMVELIEKLLKQGQAYQTSDGVYFQVASFPTYGQLSKQPIEATDQADDQSHDKKDPRDFALWKFQTPADGPVGWDAPFGKGRPGWHIECSAMSQKELGEQIDLHTGGIDLTFPHHENEITQSESASGKRPFVKYWIHTAFVNVEGQKMSKSLHNIYTLNDLAAKGISPLAYRLWLLQAHYRTPVNFTWEAAQGAQNRLTKIQNEIRELPDGGKVDPRLKEEFLKSINDDLNLPRALAVIPAQIEMARNISPADEKAAWLEFDRVFGLGLTELKPIEISPELAKLLTQREEARKAQNWALADQLRAQIEAQGYLIKDTDSGPKLTKF